MMMSKDKQIESNDWLTKGYSEKELEKMKTEAIKEAEIEAMAKVIHDGELARNRGDLDCTEFPTDVVIKVGLQRLAGAKALYNEGYRKVSEILKGIEDLFKRYRVDVYGGYFYSSNIKEEFNEFKKKYTEDKQ